MPATVNGSSISPLADALYQGHFSTDSGLLPRLYSGVNGLSVCISFFLVLVAYDQCILRGEHSTRDLG